MSVQRKISPLSSLMSPRNSDKINLKTFQFNVWFEILKEKTKRTINMKPWQFREFPSSLIYQIFKETQLRANITWKRFTFVRIVYTTNTIYVLTGERCKSIFSTQKIISYRFVDLWIFLRYYIIKRNFITAFEDRSQAISIKK